MTEGVRIGRAQKQLFGLLSFSPCPPITPEPHHAIRGHGREALEIGTGAVQGRASHARAGADDCLGGRPLEACRLAENEHWVGSLTGHEPSHCFGWHRTNFCDHRDHFPMATASGKLDQYDLVELSFLAGSLGSELRRRAIARSRCRDDLSQLNGQFVRRFPARYRLSMSLASSSGNIEKVCLGKSR